MTAGVARTVLFVSLCLGATGAGAAPLLLVDAGGFLAGATGVDVGGVLYDVEFVDGDCAALFSGCDATSDFLFQSETTALAASQALLDSVFLNGDPAFGELQYDLFPGLTFGCGTKFATTRCRIYTPYALNLVDTSMGPRPILDFAIAQNSTLDVGDTVGSGSVDVVSIPDVQTTGPGGLENQAVWARWSVAGGSATPVPEPSAFASFATGLLTIRLATRRKPRRPTR